MEVVCLILGPILASQPCSHAFWVLTSLPLLFLCFLLFLFPVFFFSEWCEYFVDCRNTGVSYI